MHGRIKTITSAEQKLKQKKIREEKVRTYKELMQKIHQKKKEQQFDDEALILTRDVLQANPDIITIWNFRREILLAKKDDLDIPDFQLLLSKELSLTEMCLRVNPKSYGTWHQRLWILDLMPSEMWSKEVALCDKYLSLDERNFHCWDYRKLVVAKAKVSDIDEYNFTTSKIESNFSNYSAWHYRSKLLPKLFKDDRGMFPLEEQKHKDELNLVQDAAFTDPDDQSAWFYQRWLLGLRQPKLAIVSAHIVGNEIIIALSRAIYLNKKYYFVAKYYDEELSGDWQSTFGKASATFVFESVTEALLDKPICIQLKNSDYATPVDSVEFSKGSPFGRSPLFSPDYSSGLKETLQEQLKYCDELLELEPDSKWTLLTNVFLKYSLDLRFFETDILNGLNQLLTVDPYRAGYYNDLISKIRFEIALQDKYHLPTFSLSENLSCIYHTNYLVLTTNISLAENKLKDVHLKTLACLFSCKVLILDSNLITNMDYLPVLKNLEFISVKNNPLINVDDCKRFLESFPNMKEIIL